MLIGEIVHRTGLSVHTLRFYERIGLIAAASVRRLPNNYRDYNEGTIETLKFIKYGQTIGFSLGEMADLNREGNLLGTPRKRQLELLDAKLAEIDEKITETKKLRKMILEKIGALRGEVIGRRRVQGS